MKRTEGKEEGGCGDDCPFLLRNSSWNSSTMKRCLSTQLGPSAAQEEASLSESIPGHGRI